MVLIIGLGNPGKEYHGTRHNVGWEVLAALAESEGTDHPWRTSDRFHAEVLDWSIADARIILARPTTFMNDSGRAVFALVRNLRLTAYSLQLLIVHDDLDLPVGTLRLSDGGSSGGHRGVQSVIDHLGTKDFLRLRIGIGPNTTADGRRIPAEDFVLKPFREGERPQIDTAVAKTVGVIETLVHDGLDAAKRVAAP